jgi:hypothetical protein
MRSCVATAVAVLALLGGGPQALAAGQRPKHPPTELWNAFPLDPQRSPTDRAALERVASRRALPPQEEKSWVVFLVLSTLIVVGATFAVRPRLAMPLVIALHRKTRNWRA